jgi:hypothetical protein
VAAQLECMAGEKIKKGASNLVRALERELREAWEQPHDQTSKLGGVATIQRPHRAWLHKNAISKDEIVVR